MRDWIRSVYSDGSNQFVSNPLPKKGEEVEISVRCIKNSELQHVVLRAKVNGAEKLITMTKSKEVNGLEYYSCRTVIWEDQFRYQFYFATKDQIFYYTQYRITNYVPDEEYDFCILTDYQQPSWVQNSVFYQIFPDRFYNGDPDSDVKTGEYTFEGHETTHVDDWTKDAAPYYEGYNLDFYGGDLKGIEDKIPYLKELGVTALYLNPIFSSATVHKYDCIDYFNVDQHLGGNEALASLCRALHKNGMKIVLDISINHTGTAHKWFNKEGTFYPTTMGAYHNPDSEERSYYFIKEDNRYLGWCGIETLPVLNYTNTKLKDKIYRAKDSVIKKWLKEPYCIDGWRFDVADVMARNDTYQLHKEIWPELRKSIKEENKDAYVLGEDWGYCIEHLCGDEWDGTMNYYACARPIREFVGEIDLFQARKEEINFQLQRMTAEQLHKRIIQFLGKLPFTMQGVQFNLIDSHDVSRLHNSKSVSFEDYQVAVTLYFTLPGTPSIYYGDELNIKGRVEDVDGCRFPMPWQYGKEESIQYQLYKKLANLKTTKKALYYGGIQFISTENYVIAYARCYDLQTVFVVASMDGNPRLVEIPYRYFGYETCESIKEGLNQKMDWQIVEDHLHVIVPPHSSYIFEINI